MPLLYISFLCIIKSFYSLLYTMAIWLSLYLFWKMPRMLLYYLYSRATCCRPQPSPKQKSLQNFKMHAYILMYWSQNYCTQLSLLIYRWLKNAKLYYTWRAQKVGFKNLNDIMALVRCYSLLRRSALRTITYRHDIKRMLPHGCQEIYLLYSPYAAVWLLSKPKIAFYRRDII